MFEFLKVAAQREDTLPAILGEDLAGFLKAINRLEDVENGCCFCRVCGSVITLQNLQFIVPQEAGEFQWICNDPNCVEAFRKQRTAK